MANLILWRHAEAEVVSGSGQDIDRALTKRGRKDAAKMAKWLAQHLPANTEIFCSPARRCLETTAALRDLTGLEINVVEFLGIDGSVGHIAQKLTDEDSTKTVLIVGHQPNLGWLIAKLCGMDDSACVVKKGSVWWLRQRFLEGALQYYIYTVRQPE
jgi:phosphohistidine phosphatase